MAKPKEPSPIYEFTIKGRLAGLNEYTNSNRNNRYGGNKAKKDAMKLVKAYLPKPLKKRIKYPVWFHITWFEPNNRRDADNVIFSTKFIWDAMVNCGLLENDNRKHISGITPKVKTDKDNPRIEVMVFETT